MINKFGILLTGLILASCANQEVNYNLSETNSNSVSTLNSKESSDSYFKNVISTKKSIGLVVAFIRNDKVSFSSYGFVSQNSKVAPNENNIFHIASISKAFTGVLLGEMVAKGEVSLDTSLESLLPNGVKVPMLENKSIKLVDLATHTSGLPNNPDNLEKINYNPLDPYANYKSQNGYDFLKSYKLTQDDTKKVGYGYSNYSNLGFGLLGHSLGLKSKSNFETTLKNKITDPLGLKNTTVATESSNIKDTTIGHYFYEGKFIEAPMSHFSDILAGGAALKSNAKDLSVFVQANMGVIPTSLRKGMDISHQEIFKGQGLGWVVTPTQNGREIIWHNGAWTPSGFCSFIGFDKKNKNGLVILSNTFNYYTEIAPAGIEALMYM